MNAFDLVERERQLQKDIAGLSRSLRGSRLERRSMSHLADRRIAQSYREVRDEAQQVLTKREQDAESAERSLSRLEDRLRDGDDTVVTGDLSEAENAIKRAELLIPSARQALVEADHDLGPFLADDELAYLAADAIEAASDVPVLIHKRPEDAPAIEPAVILSQVRPTSNYGSLDASGTVEVTLVGDVDLDLPSIEQALCDNGSDVAVTADAFTFNRATWPLPVLRSPDVQTVVEFSGLFVARWHALLEIDHQAQRLYDAGYNIQRSAFNSGLSALSHRLSETLTYDAGKATGAATLLLSVRPEGGGLQFSHTELVNAATEVVQTFRSESIGLLTEAGEVVDIRLARAEPSDGSVWNLPVAYGVTGNPLYPATIEVEILLDYIYEPAKVVASD